MVPKGFALVHIADMDFDDGSGDSPYGVGQRDGGMGQCAGVQYDTLHRKTRFMEFVDQSAFVVALKIFERCAGKTLLQIFEKILEGLAAVNFGFPFAQQIEIGAVDDENFHKCKIRPKFGRFSGNIVLIKIEAMKKLPSSMLPFIDRSAGAGKHTFCFLLLCFCLLPCVSPAQSIHVSEGISIRNDYGYELIGRLRDRILLFRDKFDDFEVQAYDNQMRLSWTRSLEDLDKRGVQILSVVGSKNDFSVVHKLRRRNRSFLRIHKYDPGANLIDSMTIKDYGERLFSPPVLEIVRSEDKNCFVVFNSSERNKLEITCFRLDKMQTLWDKTIPIDDEFYESGLKAMALSNAGDFFIVNEMNNRRSRLGAHEFLIARINGGTDQYSHIPLGEFLTSDMRFIFDNKNQRLVAGGLYAEKNRDRANGVFYLSLLPGDTTGHVLHYEPFDDKFISVLRQKDVSEDTKGIENADVKQLVLRQDGGVVVVVERQHEIQRGSAAGRGFWREGMRMVVDFYYDDMFIIAMHPDGRTHWKTVLHKKQYSQDDEGTFSSYFLVRGADKLRVLFNDEIKYENTCSEYVISPNGDFDRNSLVNTIGQNLRLRFRDALQISAGECLIPSEFRNKLRLVLLRFQ